MENNLNFKTYLLVIKKNFIISVRDDSNKKIYEEKLDLKKEIDDINFEMLDNFLNQNIFKIEKKIGNFIKKILIVTDLEDFLTVEVSIKKKINDNLVDLKYLLNEAKDSCKNTIDERRIIHMIINSYCIDDIIYSSLPKDFKCKNFSIDVRFICLSNILIKNFEDTLKKYQISLSKIISAKYLNEFMVDDKSDIFSVIKSIVEGYNPNEVILADKTSKKVGFFEKFFNFFS